MLDYQAIIKSDTATRLLNVFTFEYNIFFVFIQEIYIYYTIFFTIIKYEDKNNILLWKYDIIETNINLLEMFVWEFI